MTNATKLIVLDRDGVINEDSEDFIKSPDEWKAIDGSLEAIAMLHQAGYRVVVATNQSGLGRGLFSEAQLQAIHEKMRAAIENAGGRLAGIYYCPHHPNEGCDCRKPAPGLLRRVAADFGVSLQGTPCIGDKRSDLDAALAVGARPILVRTGYGEATLRALAQNDALEVHRNLLGAARVLASEAAR